MTLPRYASAGEIAATVAHPAGPEAGPVTAAGATIDGDSRRSSLDNSCLTATTLGSLDVEFGRPLGAAIRKPSSPCPPVAARPATGPGRADP